MKVTSLPNTSAYFERINRSHDATKREEGQSAPGYDQQPKKDGEETPEPFDLEKLGKEITGFEQDPTTVAHGLQAAVEGSGPGLRVTLKDGNGAFVRQFTGEEFLKLREAAQGLRGRLLDKKL